MIPCLTQWSQSRHSCSSQNPLLQQYGGGSQPSFPRHSGTVRDPGFPLAGGQTSCPGKPLGNAGSHSFQEEPRDLGVPGEWVWGRILKLKRTHMRESCLTHSEHCFFFIFQCYYKKQHMTIVENQKIQKKTNDSTILLLKDGHFLYMFLDYFPFIFVQAYVIVAITICMIGLTVYTVVQFNIFHFIL